PLCHPALMLVLWSESSRMIVFAECAVSCKAVSLQFASAEREARTTITGRLSAFLMLGPRHPSGRRKLLLPLSVTAAVTISAKLLRCSAIPHRVVRGKRACLRGCTNRRHCSGRPLSDEDRREPMIPRRLRPAERIRVLASNRLSRPTITRPVRVLAREAVRSQLAICE